MLVYSIRVSQGSVATCLRYDGIFNDQGWWVKPLDSFAQYYAG